MFANRARSGRLGAALVLTLTLAAPATAGEVLEGVQARGILRCGVSEGIPGFSEQDASGQWRGLDVDFCRAVAAAAVGDPDKVKFVPLSAAARFPALQAKTIDLLVRNTTWNLMREAVLKVQFPAVLLLDGQGFMVPAGSQVGAPEDLAGATVCVARATTSERNLRAYFEDRRLAVTPLLIESAREVATAFYAGRCLAYTSDAAQLAAMRLLAPGGPEGYRILPQRISKEPLGPVIWAGDPEWATVVRWVLFALILGEEEGVTQANLDQVLAERRTLISHLQDDEKRQLADAMGLKPGWAARALKAVGNYGEMYERNLGSASPLKLDRGPNRLWRDGGVMYAPPID